MPIDINEFLPTFIEESMEVLEDAEKILLSITDADYDKEDIHRLFRYMHSLKGNSAAFNFMALAKLAHTLEENLDVYRQDKKRLNQTDIDLLLQAIDQLRIAIIAIKNKKELDVKSLESLDKTLKDQIQFEEITISSPHDKKIEEILQIIFTPDAALLNEKDEIGRLIVALHNLGKLDIEMDAESLPLLFDMNPENCYLKWTFRLQTQSSIEEIRDLFSWVTDEHSFKVTLFKDQEPSKESNKEEKFKKKPLKISEEELTSQSFIKDSVRISTEKIDYLINLVGEFVITQSRVNQIVSHFDNHSLPKLIEATNLLDQHSRDLQNNIMQIRLVPLHFLFDRFTRVIRDLSKKLHKQIEIIIKGEQTEIDKSVMEKITDPMLHLIRNAVDHGIETTAERKERNKPDIGHIKLNAYQENGYIIIEVSDDGRGLDKDKIYKQAVNLGLITENSQLSISEMYQLIFSPGFTTSETLTDISGRGVGLDVVYKNILNLSGEIEVVSEKEIGTTFRLRIPLTMAIMEGQLVKVNQQIYVVPLIAISEIKSIEKKSLKIVDAKNIFYYFRDAYISVIPLELFFYDEDLLELENKLLIIVEVKGKCVGFVVDEIASQQQIVIKNLDNTFKKINGISGVTILGDGQIAYILDIYAITENFIEKKNLRTRNFIIQENIKPKVLPEKVPHGPEDSFQILSFLMHGQEYGINVEEIKEIRMWEDITYLPNSPSYLNGIINIRGMVVPVIDLNKRLSFPSVAYDKKTAIIILTVNFLNKIHHVGAIVEQVLDHYVLKYKEVQPFPNKADSILEEIVKGVVKINNKMVMLLDAKDLFSVVEKEI